MNRQFKCIRFFIAVFIGVVQMGLAQEAHADTENVQRIINETSVLSGQSVSKLELQRILLAIDSSRAEILVVQPAESGLVTGGEERDHVVYAAPEFRVIGFTEQEILDLAGEYRDSQKAAACSSQYQQGDWANRWCHAAITKSIRYALIERGMDARIASALAATFFVPKEYLVDLHPSTSDLVLYLEKSTQKNLTFEFSIYGDGGGAIAVRRFFK